MKKRLTLLGVLALIALGLLTTVAAAGPVHFAGVPPAGVKPSAPTVGQMVVSLRPNWNTSWNVYADGRVIWQIWTPSGDATVIPPGASALDTGYVQQRLTPEGVQLLRSKIAATGLFDHDLKLDLGGSNKQVFDRARVGTRIVSVTAVSSGGTKATPAELNALTSLEGLVADPSTWLPSGAWADSRIRPFVPARYIAAFDRSPPDLSKLPRLARKAFSRYYLGHGHLLTTAHTRALLHAFVRAGIRPDQNLAISIAFFLVGSEKTPTGRRIPSDFHFSPALPDGLG